MKCSCFPAFSLIEFLIYFITTLTLFTVTMHWVVRAHVQYKNNNERCVQVSRLASSLDCLVYDLCKSPASYTKWKLVENNVYIWSEGNIDIGWEMCNNALWRSQGKYNDIQQEWTERVRNLITQNITECTLTLDVVQDRIVGVRVTLKSNTIQEQYYVIVRNGKIV